MFSFKGFITTEKNTHLEHLEDDIINRGSEGGRNAVSFLKSVRNMLAGSASGRVNMSVKWDGAPAIIAGRNVSILKQLHQPADHPINIFHPESEYLKGLILKVE